MDIKWGNYFVIISAIIFFFQISSYVCMYVCIGPVLNKKKKNISTKITQKLSRKKQENVRIWKVENLLEKIQSLRSTEED